MLGKTVIFALVPFCTEVECYKLWISGDMGFISSDVAELAPSFCGLCRSQLYYTKANVFPLSYTIYWYPISHMQASLLCGVHRACDLSSAIMLG